MQPKMELLAATVFLTVFLCSNAQSLPVVASADCNDAEIVKDAGLALDLINKHRREGYVFTLLRVADAHVQRVGNAAILYFTLDVLDTECPVLSRANWSSCGQRPFYPFTEFGQCKAVLYKNPFSEREKLFGYNCTISPVPEYLYECKDCPVKITNLLDAERYIEEAQKILEKYKQKSNETRNFQEERVLKAFSAIGSQTVHYVEFIIREVGSPEAGFQKNASRFEFPPKRHGLIGFCKGKIVQDSGVVEGDSCVIYDIPHIHHHHSFHTDSGEAYHNCSGQGCRLPPHGLSQRDHHNHQHHPPDHHHHHHGSGKHQRHRSGHDHRCPRPPRFGHRRTKGHRSSSEENQGKHPDFPPSPPHGGPHHFPPHGPPPPCPPDGPCPHPHPPPPPLHFLKSGDHQYYHHHHHHDCRLNDTADEQGGISSEHGSLRHRHSFHHIEGDSVYYVPVLKQNDVLQAPGTNFLDHHPHGPHGGSKKRPFPGRHTHEKTIVQPFPEIPSESKSCPGNLKSAPPTGLLLLYLSQSKQ